MANVTIPDLTEDTDPHGDDFLETHDASASASKKIKLHRATKFKVNQFSRDISTASGTQGVTGVGFTPKAIEFIAAVDGTANQISWGFDDGAGRVCVFKNDSGNHGIDGAHSIRIFVSSGNVYEGIVNSFDSDGFTISWTKTGSPTGTATVLFKAHR